jgi:hypothetical protein
MHGIIQNHQRAIPTAASFVNYHLATVSSIQHINGAFIW